MSPEAEIAGARLLVLAGQLQEATEDLKAEVRHMRHPERIRQLAALIVRRGQRAQEVAAMLESE